MIELLKNLLGIISAVLKARRESLVKSYMDWRASVEISRRDRGKPLNDSVDSLCKKNNNK